MDVDHFPQVSPWCSMFLLVYPSLTDGFPKLGGFQPWSQALKMALMRLPWVSWSRNASEFSRKAAAASANDSDGLKSSWLRVCLKMVIFTSQHGNLTINIIVKHSGLIWFDQ